MVVFPLGHATEVVLDPQDSWGRDKRVRCDDCEDVQTIDSHHDEISWLETQQQVGDERLIL
jgi:hypothetical protein